MGTVPVFSVTGYASGPTNFGASVNERIGTSIARWQQSKQEILESLRCQVPAIVRSFDPGPPATVTVQIVTQERFQWNTGGPDVSASSPVNIQVQQVTPGGAVSGAGGVAENIIADVPLCIPTGGGWSFTVPVQPGDEVLLCFSDTEIDGWFQSGGTGNNPISSRRHSLSDAIAVFGLRSTPTGLDDWSTTSAQIRSDDGTVVIDLADDQITITAPNVVIDAVHKANTNADTIALAGTTSASVAAPAVGVTASQTATVSGPGGSSVTVSSAGAAVAGAAASVTATGPATVSGATAALKASGAASITGATASVAATGAASVTGSSVGIGGGGVTISVSASGISFSAPLPTASGGTGMSVADFAALQSSIITYLPAIAGALTGAISSRSGAGREALDNANIALQRQRQAPRSTEALDLAMAAMARIRQPQIPPPQIIVCTQATFPILSQYGPTFVYVSDYAHWIWFDGSTATFADGGSGYYAAAANTPSAIGWHAVNGATVNILNADGTTYSKTLVDTTSNPSFIEVGTGSDTIVSAVAPGFTGALHTTAVQSGTGSTVVDTIGTLTVAATGTPQAFYSQWWIRL